MKLQLAATHTPGAPRRVLVVERKRSKKKRKRDARATRELRSLESATLRSSERMASSLQKGLASYRKLRKKARRKGRAEILTSMPLNSAKAMSDSMREASKIPRDVARRIDDRSLRRAVRRSTRFAFDLIERR